MKRKLIKNLLLVLTLVVLCLAVGVTASAETWDGYVYDVLENGTVEITEYIGDDAEVIIPSEIDGMRVAEISFFSFENNITMEKVFVPSCVEYIDFGAFYGCYKLEKIEVDPNNNNYSSDEEGVLFDKEKKSLIQYPNGKKDRKYIVPEGVKIICEGSFGGLLDLEELVLPDSLEIIEEQAINACLAITEIRVPSNVKSIEDLAFCYSMYIERIYIESNDVAFGEYIPLSIGNVRMRISQEEFINLVKSYAFEKDEDKKNQKFRKILDYVIYEDVTIYPTIYCHENSTTETYIKEKSIEDPKNYTFSYNLTHFYEDEWTYDYDNLVRYRKCIHCDELETEAIEPEIPTEPETPEKPEVTPNKKENFYIGLFEVIKAFFELLERLFSK